MYFQKIYFWITGFFSIITKTQLEVLYSKKLWLMY